MRGGIFRMICTNATCSHQWEQFLWQDKISTATCPTCSSRAVRVAASESGKHGGMDYDQPVLSESMGVSADQVPEHRRLFPDIPITDDGRVILRNHYEAKRIRKAKGFFDRAGYC